MEITSRFNRDDFEVWIDHFQYLDIGERHQSVPSGKSYVRGTFDPEQNAYVIDKIHIDPDMLRTDVEEELLHEAKLQAHKRDKRLLQKNRVAAMPKHNVRMRMERDQPQEDRPMITRDLRKKVKEIANSLNQSLWEPPSPGVPGDKRWRVSGLSHSSWAINHPDIMTEGESPLTLRIKKLPDGRWAAFGQNNLTNLSNITTLTARKTPPGGDDWEDIETFAGVAAEYFQKQKESILALKQAMTPQNAPSPGEYTQQQGGGGEMGGMGGGMGGMMASRRARRRKAAEFKMTPAQAMNALDMKGSGSVEQDRRNLAPYLKSHPDRAGTGGLAEYRYTAANVLLNTYIRQNQPLPRDAAAAQAESGQGATVGGPGSEGQVNQEVQGLVTQAVERAGRVQKGLQQSLSTQGGRANPQTMTESINAINRIVYKAAIYAKANLGPGSSLSQKLMEASNFLNAVAGTFSQPGHQITEQVLNGVIKNLTRFIQMGNAAVNPTKTKKSSRRASATLDNLNRAKRIAHQIHRNYADQDWFLGVRVVNDRDGIALGIGAESVPPRSLRASLEGIPLVLEGPGGRMVRAQQEGNRRLRLALRMVAAEVAEGLGVDPEEEKALKHHQKLVKRVYHHIKNNKRLFGSVRYMSRKLGIDFNDLVRVIGQLIVEGKIEMTKKKKFKPLEPPHTPVPGMAGKFAATNSVFGIDRGRSDKRVDQLLSQSNYQLNMYEHKDNDDGIMNRRDIREQPSKIMPDPTQPN